MCIGIIPERDCYSWVQYSLEIWEAFTKEA